MRVAGTIVLLAAVALAAGGAASSERAGAALPCARSATAAYAASVRAAVESGRDLWGDRLIASAAGPTYHGARSHLTPLLNAVQRRSRPLTDSGVYYVPLSFPFTPYGSAVFALHVADGSEIITRRIDGPSLSLYVGYGRERYGSCTSRLQPARLAAGHLPILQTAYTDAHGVRYRQESFVGRAYGVYGARSVISFVKLTVDTRHATTGAIVRLVPWKRLAHAAPDRFAADGQTRLIVSDGARFVDGVVRYAVAKGDTTTVYAQWLNAPSPAQHLHATAAAYATARATVVKFWEGRLAEGARFDVPEPIVRDAQLATLWQQIAYGWRYSIGNEYEELSYGESLDAAEVMAAYGQTGVARAMLEYALYRMRVRPERFTGFRAGHLLSTAATYFQLTKDSEFVERETGHLAALVSGIAARQVREGPARGRLVPEPLSTDLEPSRVDSVPGQAEAILGLLGAARMWGATGHSELAARARTLAFGIRAALEPAVTRSLVITPDATLFVPASLSTPAVAYPRLTASKDGSYWNLVMPYTFASGLFAPQSPAAEGIVRYVLTRGARLLGVARTYARSVYGHDRGAGLGSPYGVPWSRFFADNDKPDQLVLSLYGMLAASMQRDTFVSGEATSILPVNGAWYRTMYMPPNSGSNASYLATLHELLVHERRGPSGETVGLDLAFATPRAWLADGERIAVTGAPTSLGKVSYALERHGAAITGTLSLPRNAHARLRLRVPEGERLASVAVSGARLPFDRWSGTIDLGARRGALSLRATVTR